jgi:Domain of unknown function (DUF4398)
MRKSGPLAIAMTAHVSHNSRLTHPQARDADVMTPNSSKIYGVVGILAVILSACGPTKPPPDIGMDTAARTLADARAAGAPTYAPLELRNAEDRLSQARASFDKNDFGDASRYASESRVDSELAMVKSRLGKAREKADNRARENTQLQQEIANGISPTASPAGDQQ